MTFYSILFEKTEDGVQRETLEAPDFFVDLNLDQIIDAITTGKGEYDLKPFFYTSLHDVDAIQYRHEIFQDLEDTNLLESIKSFAQKMRVMRDQLAQSDKLHYKYQKERWFLEAVATYGDAVERLVDDLSLIDLRSRGLLAFRQYLTQYVHSERFKSLMAETQKLLADLSTVRYCLLIKGNTIKVRKYESESDYSAEVEETFEKFKQGAVKDYRVKFRDWADMNHVEAGSQIIS
jgi:DNA mismatch repair protein MutS